MTFDLELLASWRFGRVADCGISRLKEAVRAADVNFLLLLIIFRRFYVKGDSSSSKVSTLLCYCSRGSVTLSRISSSKIPLLSLLFLIALVALVKSPLGEPRFGELMMAPPGVLPARCWLVGYLDPSKLASISLSSTEKSDFRCR